MASTPNAPLNEQFISTVRDNRIPPCPAVLERISIEMNKDDPDFRHLTNIIASDVGLAAGLIKLANSPYFGTRRRVASVNEALLILGLDTASQAVACIALGEAFPNLKHMERFWDASARIATLSGWLAQEYKWQGVRSQEAYTYGLFRDCGIAVLLQHFPDYTKVLKLANAEQQRTFTAVEDDVLPTNHAVMGAMMTQSWWLPEAISEAVRYHHESKFSEPVSESAASYRHLIAIAQLAEHLLQDATGLSHTAEWGKLGPLCLEQLGLTEEDVITLAVNANRVMSDTSAH